MISAINPTKLNPNFKATLHTNIRALNNSGIQDLFRERTSNYPKLILKQEEALSSDKYKFILWDKDLLKILSAEDVKLMANPPETQNEYLEKFLKIFDDLVLSAIKSGKIKG